MGKVLANLRLQIKGISELHCKIVLFKFIFTMKIQLLRRTVKLRIDRHIIVIPREKDNMHNYPLGFQGGLQSKTLCFVS